MFPLPMMLLLSLTDEAYIQLTIECKPYIGATDLMVLILPKVVPSWLLGRIDEWMLDKGNLAVAPLDAQHFVMECLVVMPAQHETILSAGFTVI